VHPLFPFCTARDVTCTLARRGNHTTHTHTHLPPHTHTYTHTYPDADAYGWLQGDSTHDRCGWHRRVPGHRHTSGGGMGGRTRRSHQMWWRQTQERNGCTGRWAGVREGGRFDIHVPAETVGSGTPEVLPPPFCFTDSPLAQDMVEAECSTSSSSPPLSFNHPLGPSQCVSYYSMVQHHRVD
jgi:hypothetical protein